jgi:hypothetical protein
MGSSLEELLKISSTAICHDAPSLSSEPHFNAAECRPLLEWLKHKNGFFAFEGALHVFPAGCQNNVMDLERWNQKESWKAGYGEVANNYLFFAEDVFGGQFGLRAGRIYRFDPETGDAEEMAADLEGWSTRLLDNYEYETGYPVAHEWQVVNGPLAPGNRLMPRKPFVVGGGFNLENFYAIEAVHGMKLRAILARQIQGLPDGTSIKFDPYSENWLVQ